jgi:hypothetical protein
MRPGKNLELAKIKLVIKKMSKKRFRVVLTEGNYPDERGSMQILIGIFPRHKSAEFIAKKVQEKLKLGAPLEIDTVEGDAFPITTALVDDYLKRKDEEKVFKGRT